MEKEMVSLIAMLFDIGFDRGLDLIKAFETSGATLPSLEVIKAEIDKWQPRADAVTEEIANQ